MPDSLTRWRFTGRAIDPQGNVGQQVAWVRSDKPFYAKWTSPSWQREGDKAVAAVALFNQTGADAVVEWQASAAGFDRHDKATLKPGVNFIDVPLAADHAGALPLQLTIRHDGQVVDQLALDLQRLPVGWRAPRELQLNLAEGAPALALPADATHLRVAFAQDPSAGEFHRWMDSLIEFPYGCVEQTSSRMLPLTMALESLSPAQQGAAPLLAQRLASARTSLAAMAGPQARFGWWGRGMSDDTFLTAYAYYADWRATRALHLTLPDEHWQGLLDAWASDKATAMTPLQRAMALAWMQEMGLPVGTMVQAQVDELVARPAGKETAARSHGSDAMREQSTDADDDMALVLAAATAERAHAAPRPDVKQRADAAAARLAASEQPFVRALLMASQRAGTATAPVLLGQVSAATPTIDRAQTLVWLQHALGHRIDATAADAAALAMPAPWQRTTGASGEPLWSWPAGQPLPATLALPSGGKPTWASVDFDSLEPQAARLPAHLVRKLWKLVPQHDAAPAKGDAAGASGDDGRLDVRLELVAPGTPLSTDTLYLDEVDVRADAALRHALVEVALPPGATVEASTWGIDIETDKGKVVALERAQQQDIAQGYAVPIDALAAGESVAVRHLVRIAQRGQFNVPPVRLHRMYDPEARAFDASGAWGKWDVR